MNTSRELRVAHLPAERCCRGKLCPGDRCRLQLSGSRRNNPMGSLPGTGTASGPAQRLGQGGVLLPHVPIQGFQQPHTSPCPFSPKSLGITPNIKPRASLLCPPPLCTAECEASHGWTLATFRGGHIQKPKLIFSPKSEDLGTLLPAQVAPLWPAPQRLCFFLSDLILGLSAGVSWCCCSSCACSQRA